jgi:phosphatidylinositol glycan class B
VGDGSPKPIAIALQLWSALLIHIASAYFHLGYQHPDEHFRLLGFANYRLGLFPASDLPWEYGQKMHLALQSAIAAMVYQTLLLEFRCGEMALVRNS